MTIEEIKKKYGDSNDYIWCDDCPLYKDTHCTVGLSNKCDGKDVAYRAIQGHCFSNNSTSDPVNHPSHYTKGKIEVADFIADQKLNFDRGNAVKYVCRAGSKDPEKEIQDLEKAIWYIKHEIKMLKGEDADAAQEEN